MNKIIFPNQEHEVVPLQLQPDIYIKTTGIDDKSLIEFLKDQRIAFVIVNYGEESKIFSNINIAKNANRLPTDIQQILENIYLKYILKQVAPQPTIEQIAAEIGWSLAKFKAKFKAYYGRPFYQVYVDKKMEYAAQLLRAGYKAVEVSKKVGYQHPIKFNKMFQKHYGITPHTYKKQHYLEQS